MHVGWALALLGVHFGLSALIARLAVDPLRGRSVWQARGYILLVTTITAMPEAISPLIPGPDRITVPAIVNVALTSNLLALVGLLLAEVIAGGRLLSRAGLDHLLAVVCAAVMTLATAGAVLIESTEPVGAPFGHVLSLGLLIACVVHLNWASRLEPVERSPNPRAPLRLLIPVGLIASAFALVLGLLLLGWLYPEWSRARGGGPDYPSISVAALAVIPELAILRRAIAGGRPDIGCAILLGSVILNLASMAIVDLVDVRAAAYRQENPVLTLTVALVSTGLLGAMGMRLVHDERRVGA